ncbi:MAG: PAS domain-containing sensor histidine kinase [Cupriavidus sp.]|nr:PAS domain-containing sensor histidine kinase [Cupriavidus sp.]
METTVTPMAGAAQPGLATAFAAWARVPALAATLGARDTVHFVVDPSAGQILYASDAAAPLADTLTGSALVGLIRQIVAATAGDAAPRLARLRLDVRRIAPPALCWLARGTQADGRPAILVVPTTPVTAARARPVRPVAPPASASAPPAHPQATPSSMGRDNRFLWRIDAAGVLTTLTGPEALAGLVGQRWQDMAATGLLSEADSVLTALRDRRTFRGESAVLDAGTGPFRVDLSGAPLGRGDAAFSGFGGFGLIRSAPNAIKVVAEPAAPTPESSVSAPASPLPEPVEVERPVAPAPDLIATPLSTDEHAAFREIARALGARYAGDEVDPESGAPKAESGAVMPFPAPQTNPADLPLASEEASTETDGASVEPPVDVAAPPQADLLAGLPLPTLIHHNGTIVAANRGFLDLTGHPDLPSLARTGLSGLLPGLPPSNALGDALGDAARRTTVKTVEGHTRPVELLSGAFSWAGAAATCLIARPVDEADVADALTAERLARAAQTERTARAEAALDALEIGVVTVDGAGRIVALNHAAADLFGCDPREVVGGSFVSLFDRQSVLTIADALRGAAPERRSIVLAGKPMSLAVAGPLGRRVVTLDHAGRAAPGEAGAASRPETVPGGGEALSRLDGAVRGPVTGMIDLANAMQKEPFGPLGDTRYRDCLAEIKASGETILERVGKLLDLAAVEAGSLRLEPRALDLNDVVAGCVARLQGEAARGRVVMRTSFSTDLGDLEADERSVSRAASLVIENAIRRSAAGSQIIVSTGSAERAAVALRVRGTGAGPAPRVEDPKESVEDGLALPRALVEANGGRLQLSARPEDGTLVEIIMPTRRVANG